MIEPLHNAEACRFQNFLGGWGGGGGGMPPDLLRGSHLRRAYLITPLNKFPVNTNTLPKISATGLIELSRHVLERVVTTGSSHDESSTF